MIFYNSGSNLASSFGKYKFYTFSLTLRLLRVIYQPGNHSFRPRQLGCRSSFFAGATGCKQPKTRLLESITYEMQILQLLSFDIHTKCRGCRGYRQVYGAVRPPDGSRGEHQAAAARDGNNRSEACLYERLGRGRMWAACAGSRFRRTLAGRILRRAAWPARWQARHMYQLATVR